MQHQPKLLGLVLAGGKSSRMREAKAHISINGMPQWRYGEGVLGSVCDAVYFSVSPQLWPPLSTAKEHLIHDEFKEPIGPLGGIISAFRRFPDNTFFVLACDLPFFDQEAARYLLAKRNAAKQATVFELDDKVEPLCAIFEPSSKADLVHAWLEGRLCARSVVASLAVEKVVVPHKEWLFNLNHSHELSALVGAAERIVNVHYYASLKECTGRATETVITKKSTVGELYDELRSRYGFGLDVGALRFSRNEQLVLKNALIVENDSIVFIPPVSGG
jgi:molybdopterin-guanine dinucleotide biosynthesis protein A